MSNTSPPMTRKRMCVCVCARVYLHVRLPAHLVTSATNECNFFFLSWWMPGQGQQSMSKASKACHCTNGGKAGHATKILKCVMFFRSSWGPLSRYSYRIFARNVSRAIHTYTCYCPGIYSREYTVARENHLAYHASVYYLCITRIRAQRYSCFLLSCGPGHGGVGDSLETQG